MPLFHSNSTGSLNGYQNIPQQQFQQVTDPQTFTMGGGGNTHHAALSSSTDSLTPPSEINVAYDGTFADLGAADGSMFDVNDNFDFTQFGDANQGFTAINNDGFAPNGATVSPKDLFNTTDSVPPSTSFTNLTTPGSTFLETPDEDYQTSPLFTDNLDVHDTDQQWYSLFPEDSSTPAAPMMARTTSSSSANQVMVHPGGEAHNRKRSSTNASPMTFASPAVRHSSVAGVNPTRKRDKPLPPIMVDENDAVALKRARNTAAARKSRAKKVEERETLEAEIADLKAQVEHWKSLALGRVKAEGGDE